MSDASTGDHPAADSPAGGSFAAKTTKAAKKNILVQTWKEFSADDGLRLAAALAYYTVLALPPMLVVILVVAAFFTKAGETVGADVTGGKGAESVVSQPLEQAIGEEGSSQLQDMLKAARDNQKSGWAALIGVAVLLFSAGTAVAQLQTGLNDIWEVEPHPQSGVVDFIKKRVLSLGMVVGLGFLVVLSVTLSAAVSALSNQVLPLPGWAAGLIVEGVTFALLTVLFAAIFKFLPDAVVEWRDTWIGAATTAALFVAAKFGLGYYLGKNDPGASYGDAGALVVILVWIYYSMAILLFGAEFTQVYARRHGSGIVPDEDAVRVLEKTEHLTPEEAAAVADLRGAEVKTVDDA